MTLRTQRGLTSDLARTFQFCDATLAVSSFHFAFHGGTGVDGAGNGGAA
jgi:hypothetical protein